mmetsp:Transcript_8884/g.13078  ORF Transcript_8884/g.13078 Transcript_8884/m.13078 type:complete len:194 (-) Transcript_8884:168-749(-)|eukprot:CAMPEP_0196803786 /NCGR_PEP_ID=MMETSP1362-20130617/3270_1 /TAXON_ID=163516 /ORGANISM="Leptocylindrus danicus, Strain CCMP1856" /LENGTH=193 /DNA_ID=CAMNT_0042175617 /DNA_START=17 /DNA_END=598 /DNA_ORIENTATION=+
MFMPQSSTETAKQKQLKRSAFSQIETWAVACVPPKLRHGLQISVQEVQCGDPNCAPIDTAITILYYAGGRGMTGIPAEAQDVREEDVKHAMPTEEVLQAWSEGKEAEWPPDVDDVADDMEDERPQLRFEVGQKVECRIGNDPVTGWAGGEIIQLWYREQGWPPNAWAPYKILLDDGRNIFAPADIDQVIRRKD